MVKPAKPKEIKASGEEGADVAKKSGGGAPALDLKFLMTMVVMLLLNVGGLVGVIYLLAPAVLVPAIVSQLPKASAEQAAEGEGEEAGGEGEEGGEHGAKAAETPSVGLPLKLDDFTVNLKTDPQFGGSQFLRAKMSLAVQVPHAEDCFAPKDPHAEGEKKAEGGGHGEAPKPDPNAPDPCMVAFGKTMDKYTPTIRDVVNTALMKRTATMLSTIEGQEALKDEIKSQLNPTFDKEHQILRVNFEEFIIQR